MPYEDKSHVGMFQCFYCQKSMGVLLDRRLRKSLPRRAGVLDMEPCSECKDLMKIGIILISIKDNTTDEDMRGEPIMRFGRERGRTPPNPYRTGGWCVVKQEAVERFPVPAKMIDSAVRRRFMFITDEGWDYLGLPRDQEIDNRPKKET